MPSFIIHNARLVQQEFKIHKSCSFDVSVFIHWWLSIMTLEMTLIIMYTEEYVWVLISSNIKWCCVMFRSFYLPLCTSIQHAKWFFHDKTDPTFNNSDVSRHKRKCTCGWNKIREIVDEKKKSGVVSEIKRRIKIRISGFFIFNVGTLLRRLE